MCSPRTHTLRWAYRLLLFSVLEYEGVETVAHRDREQVGSVGGVEHVGVGLDHRIAWDRQADHGR